MRLISAMVLFALLGAAGSPALQAADLTVARITVLTTDGGQLDWGPDGRVAFDRRTRGALYDVWVMDPNAPDKATCVTCAMSGLPPGHRGNPEWHPSGEWIIFQAGMKVGNPLVTHPGSGVANEIWAIRPDGSDARELFGIDDPRAFDGALHPHVNHAGDEIVFARFRGLPAVFAIHTLAFDADNPRRADPVEVLPAGNPDWPTALYETHGYSADDRHIVFTGFTHATGHNNDILIADPSTGELIDQVTASEDVWDEHAHFQPGTRRLLFSSSRDIRDGTDHGIFGALVTQAEWWIREEDGLIHRLTRFADKDWPLRHARMVDGTPVTIPVQKLFAADGAFSPDGNAFAGVLLFRNRTADEWIVVIDLATTPR